MNQENMELLVKRLEGIRPGDHFGFNLGIWYNINLAPDYSGAKCKTVGCIATHARELSGINSYVTTAARRWLELSYEEADALFKPTSLIEIWNEITPQAAAQAVRRLMEGKEPWADYVHSAREVPSGEPAAP